MVLKGEIETTPAMLPTIVPELQNRSVISVVSGNSHFGALTSSGKFLTWGQYSQEASGLDDPGDLPAGSLGGAKKRAKARDHGGGSPPNITVPSEVRFDHGSKAKRRVERYCFAAAASGWNAAALVIDLARDQVPPEDLEQHFESAVPRGSIERPVI